jgi:hypothetical protein
MGDWSPLDEDTLLKGTLLVRIIGREDGQPRPGRRVSVHGCGFV